jgi:methionyl-tRNA synthetase
MGAYDHAMLISIVTFAQTAPHIGHLYSATIADTLRRWYEFKGHKTQYSIGTDEHGLKVGDPQLY